MFDYLFYSAGIDHTVSIDEAISEILWMPEIPVKDRLAAKELLEELLEK